MYLVGPETLITQKKTKVERLQKSQDTSYVFLEMSILTL